jgi:hypothetical protein
LRTSFLPNFTNKTTFYVAFQINLQFFKKNNNSFCFQYFYYFCIQEVEEETGSAGEQPVSNRFPALRGNTFFIGGSF